MAWKFFTNTGQEKQSLAGSGVSYGTSLPASPVDSQEAILVDSLTLPTYQWRFRYNAGSSNTDKWEFVGGTPAEADITTNETTGSTTYVDLTTVGPSITVPRGGLYLIEIVIGTTFNTVSAGGGSTRAAAAKLGAAATSDNEAAFSGDDSTTSGTKGTAWSGRRTLAASDVVKVQYKTSVGTGNFARRSLKITPVRVS